MDMHKSVTDLREALRSPQQFCAWLATMDDEFQFGSVDPKRNDDGSYIPGIPAIEGTPMAYFLRSIGHDRTLSDTTHAYWWIKDRAYSLMLPDWARQFQRKIGEAPRGSYAKSVVS